MDDSQLWAPWRYEYVSGSVSPSESAPVLEPELWRAGADQDCFLCRAAASYSDQPHADRTNLVVWRKDPVFVILNRYPYNNGHLLVAPLRHVGSITALTDEEHLQLMRGLARLTDVLGDRIQAQGFNIGLNLGRVAGAGVPCHLHWHLVARWPGDTNFMPVTASTHVISQSLASLWDLLTQSLSTGNDND